MLQGLWSPPPPPPMSMWLPPAPPVGWGGSGIDYISSEHGFNLQKDPSPNNSSRARHPVSQAPPEDNVPGEAPEQGILSEIIDFSREGLFPVAGHITSGGGPQPLAPGTYIYIWKPAGGILEEES